jgi:hemerythrin
MGWFTWDDDFLTGTAEIDEQHRRLIALIDEFYKALGRTEPRAAIERLLRGLLEYTNYHFSTEERYMRQVQYPDLQAHLAQHEAFADKMQDVAERFFKGDLVLSLEITQFLRDWLSGHILGVDKRLGQFLASRGTR